MAREGLAANAYGVVVLIDRPRHRIKQTGRDPCIAYRWRIRLGRNDSPDNQHDRDREKDGAQQPPDHHAGAASVLLA